MDSNHSLTRHSQATQLKSCHARVISTIKVLKMKGKEACCDCLKKTGQVLTNFCENTSIPGNFGTKVFYIILLLSYRYLLFVKDYIWSSMKGSIGLKSNYFTNKDHSSYGHYCLRCWLLFVTCVVSCLYSQTLVGINCSWRFYFLRLFLSTTLCQMGRQSNANNSGIQFLFK